MKLDVTQAVSEYRLPCSYLSTAHWHQGRFRKILPKVTAVETMIGSDSWDTYKQDESTESTANIEREEQDLLTMETVVASTSEEKAIAVNGLDGLESLEQELASLTIHHHHPLHRFGKMRDTRSIIQKRAPKTKATVRPTILRKNPMHSLHEQFNTLSLEGLLVMKEFTVMSCSEYNDDSDTLSSESNSSTSTSSDVVDSQRNDYY